MSAESIKFNLINNKKVKLLKKIICSILVTIILLVDLPFNVLAAEIKSNINFSPITVQEEIKNQESQEEQEYQGVQTKVDELEADYKNQNETETKETEGNKPVATQKKMTVLKSALNNSAPSNEEENFKIALRWGGTSNTEYNWDATKSEERVIKLTFYYQNEVTTKAYEPGDLVVTVPGIGNLNRQATLKAYDVAADAYGAAELKRDWSYKYNAQTDTYTFYNNHAIEQGSTINGSFEMLYKFKSRECINDYTQTLKAELTDGSETAESQELTLNFTSLKDTFYINKTAKAVVSADGLNRFVEEGKTVADYGWVQYTIRYNVEELNARGLRNRMMIDSFPAGCVVATDRNITENIGGTTIYSISEISVPENRVQEYSIIVGYPEEYIGETVTNTAYLMGTYYEEDEVQELARSSVGIQIERVKNQTVGVIASKSMTPDCVYNDSIRNDIVFSANLYVTSTINQEDTGYKIAVTDDYMEILTNGEYRKLTDDEYKFTEIKVPGRESFTNANGYAIEDREYQLKLYALYKEDVIEGDLSSRSLENYTLVHDGMWGNSSYTQKLTKDAVAVRAEIIGLTESIKSFYITASGTINISENLENETYINPTRIINYDFIEFEDKDGNSLLEEILKKDYTQDRIYDRDYEIYGKGLIRTSDAILIGDRPITPTYYYAKAAINPFGVDENVEYFVTRLLHQVEINNKNKDYVTNVEVYGETEKVELETLIDTLVFTYSNLTFKHNLSEDVDMQDYLKQRAVITKEGKEISVVFDFSDNPIISSNFTLGYIVDARINYEDYYDSTNPTYAITTYGYINTENLAPQSVATYKDKTMSTDRDSESILLALASHQQLIKTVKTFYSGDFVQEDAVTPMNEEYTYRLKLRNGYNTLLNTEFIDILEHAELTKVDGEYPYQASEWYGTFNNVDVTHIVESGHTTEVYYANSLNPTSTDWVLMENYANGKWTTTEGNEANVKAIKVEINGEIPENSISYVDVNMTAPEDSTLIDKKAYNTYKINCNAIDLYTGLQSTYMRDMPSNVVDVRLVEKEYKVVLTKTDELSGAVLSGVEFGIYDENGNKVDAVVTNFLGITIIKGLKAGTYTIVEEKAPEGYKKMSSLLLVINNDGTYFYEIVDNKEVEEELNFTATGTYGWVQNADGTWQSNSYNKHNSSATMKSEIFELNYGGTISFDWSASSESANYDYVYYTIKDAITGSKVKGGTSTKIGGTTYGTVYDSLEFNNVSEELQPGQYYIEFCYKKDVSDSSGLDRGFVKNAKIQYVQEEVKQTDEYESEIINNIPTINLNVTNERTKGSITVHKIDEYLNTNGEENPLRGVTFDLYDIEGTFIDTQTTDELGNVTFKKLDWGKSYIIEEQESLRGYEVLRENVYLSRLDKDKIVKITNIRKEGTVELTKQDEIDGTKLEGVKFGLFAQNDIYDKNANIIYEESTLIEVAYTDNKGKVEFNNLIWGDYYIKELESIYGYELSTEKYMFTINSETVENKIQFTENEKRSKANLQLIKVDQNGNPLSGTEFNLYSGNGNVVTYNEQIDIGFTSSGQYRWSKNSDGTWQSGNNNRNSTTSIMNSEEIEIKETGILSFEWSVSSESINYDYMYYTIRNASTGETVKGGTSTKIGGTTYGTAYESLKYNKVIENLEAGKYIIEFAYTKDSSGASGLDRGFVKNIKLNTEKELKVVTDSNGLINIQGLEWGNYYLKETKSVEGYESINTEFSFVVNRDTFRNNSNTVTRVLNKDTNEEVSIIRNNKKLGKAILTKYAYDASGNETTNTLEGAIYELYLADGTLIDEYTTDEDGEILVEDLDWDSYYFQEKEAPEGYSLSDKKISFVINGRNADFIQELKAYDKLESGEITINKTINKNDIYKAHGNSTFIFKVVGKDEGEEKVTYYRTATFTEKDIDSADRYGNITKTIKITDIDPYVYEVTEEDNYRFDLETITPVSTNAEVNGNKGIITLSGVQNKGEVTFTNEKQTNSLLTDASLITNVTQTEFYVVGVKVDIKENNIVTGTVLKKDDFTYTLLYSGGQEVEVDSSVLDTVLLDGETTYSQAEMGDYIINVETTYNGKTYEEQISTKWILPRDYFIYIVNDDNTITITGINSKYQQTKVLYIPNKYNGYNVREFSNGYDPLSNINNVETVEIAEGIPSIGYAAFRGCSNLTSIEIPDSVTTIGANAFAGCTGLTSIEIPDGVTIIGGEAFYSCTSLVSVEIPDSVTFIGGEAFYGCSNLASIEIPEGVTSIKDWTFRGCSNLTSIEIPESVTSIGNQAFYRCKSLTGELVIPGSVTFIGDEAFYGCSNLTSIEIPSCVTSIGGKAFYSCTSLVSVEIVEGVAGQEAMEGPKSIGSYAFFDCRNLISIEIPEGITSIEKNAFSGCSNLTSIEIPEGVTSIGSSAFNECSSLTSIEIPEGVTSIENYVFNECSNLTSIEIPESVTSIGNYAFSECSNLTSIEIPEGVTSIGNFVFNECSNLTSIEIPEGVTSIGERAFCSCSSLTGGLVIPEGVTSIGNEAFLYCISITSIEIPESVTSIGTGTFDLCFNLTTINYHGTPEQFAAISIGSYNTYFTNATVNYITD